MNNLGGMVFIVAGIALGYWVMTGKAANFLQAINATTGQTQQQTQQPWWQVNPPWGSMFQIINTQTPNQTTGPSNSNVSQNVPANWISV